MKLSREQERVVMHGLERGKKEWTQREYPQDVKAWCEEIPKWLVDCHVDPMLEWANPPYVMYRVQGEMWPEEKLFEEEEPGMFRARSADGWLMEQHHHKGFVSPVWAWRVTPFTQWTITDPVKGESIETSTWMEARKHYDKCMKLKKDDVEPQIETKQCYATEQSNGYGGRIFWIKMKDGREIALRGPWHVAGPVGWQDMRWIEKKPDPYYDKRGTPWWKRGGTYGHFISEELIARAIARFEPTWRLAMVYPGYGHAELQPYDLSWGGPKAWRNAE